MQRIKKAKSLPTSVANMEDGGERDEEREKRMNRREVYTSLLKTGSLDNAI